MGHCPTRSRARGFTLLELVVVTSTVALLSGVLLDRVQFYQEMAERAAMQQTAGAIRTSLYLQALNLIAKGRHNEIDELAKRNPMEALAEKPANYGGEIISVRQNNVVSGHWYFNSDDKTLIYLVHNGKHFRAEHDPKQVVYRVRILRGERAENGSEKPVEGVILEQVNSFSWFKQ
ncbi:MAG TPA: type II secretion system protein [Noviherbaspirillum sp.]|nr:type II secretion system protein [Noviherbaspirillum sp.]